MKVRHRVTAVALTGLALACVAPARADQLKARGEYHGDVDGRMSDRLEAALRAFQRDHGLASHGRLDAATSAALGAGEPSASRRPCTRAVRAARFEVSRGCLQEGCPSGLSDENLGLPSNQTS